MTGRSDKDQLKYSQKEKRTLITFDRDFIKYKDSDLTNHPGVIVLSCSPTQIDSLCKKSLPKFSQSSLTEALVIVGSDHISKMKHNIVSEIK